MLILSGIYTNCLFGAFPGNTVNSETNPVVTSSLLSIDKRSDNTLSDLVYYNGHNFLIMGKYHNETNYHRLPGKYEKIVRPAVWNLSKNSSGISIRFRTNSPIIAAKWELSRVSNKPNMTTIAVSGIDLYCHVNGKWQYVNSGIPRGINNESILISDMDTTFKDFMINLPLYNGVENIEIGINSEYSIFGENRIDKYPGKPIVFYGTSITQGSSASRPGMVYTSIISRNLNIETINLGFSGNGRFEQSVGQALCEIDAELIVIDCTPNSHPDIIRNNALKLIQQIRRCHPTTPVLLIESIIREYSYFRITDPSRFGSRNFILSQNNELKNAFDNSVNMGITNLYYLEADDLIGSDHEATIDGTHLTDLGFYRFANNVQNKIVNILKLN